MRRSLRSPKVPTGSRRSCVEVTTDFAGTEYPGPKPGTGRKLVDSSTVLRPRRPQPNPTSIGRQRRE